MAHGIVHVQLPFLFFIYQVYDPIWQLFTVQLNTRMSEFFDELVSRLCSLNTAQVVSGVTLKKPEMHSRIKLAQLSIETHRSLRVNQALPQYITIET